MISDFETAPTEPVSNHAGTEDLEPDSYHGPLINLHILKTAVWRRWRVWLSVALIGMVAGAGLHFVVPRKYAAVTELYLAEPAALDPTVAITDDVSLLQTPAVAEQAIIDSHIHMATDRFLASYQVVAVSDFIVSITLSAPSQADAVSRANAVARAFFSVRSRVLRVQTDVVLAGLQSQVQSLESQVNTLTGSINSLSTSGAGTLSSSELTGLVNERSGDESQIAQLNSQMQQDQLSLSSVTKGSQVLDPAAAVRVSAKRVVAIDGLSGLAAGLGLGILALLMSFLLSDRLRTRAEVAATLGIPVELSVGRVARFWPAPPWVRARRLKRILNHPSPALRMIQHRLIIHLASARGTGLGIVEVEAAEAGALAVACLAGSLDLEERQVVIADMANGRPLASLLGIRPTKEGIYKVNIRGKAVILIVAPQDPAETAQIAHLENAGAVLVLASANPAFTADHIGTWVSEAVVLVDLSKSSPARVGATGELLRQAGISMRSAIVVGGDQYDDSVGSFTPDDQRGVKDTALGRLTPTWS